MYYISLYENGVFCTHIGGEVATLSEALEQLKRLGEGLKAEDIDGVVGIKFDRNGTLCGLLVTDRWGFPIKDAKKEEE